MRDVERSNGLDPRPTAAAGAGVQRRSDLLREIQRFAGNRAVASMARTGFPALARQRRRARRDGVVRYGPPTEAQWMAEHGVAPEELSTGASLSSGSSSPRAPASIESSTTPEERAANRSDPVLDAPASTYDSQVSRPRAAPVEVPAPAPDDPLVMTRTGETMRQSELGGWEARRALDRGRQLNANVFSQLFGNLGGAIAAIQGGDRGAIEAGQDLGIAVGNTFQSMPGAARPPGQTAIPGPAEPFMMRGRQTSAAGVGRRPLMSPARVEAFVAMVNAQRNSGRLRNCPATAVATDLMLRNLPTVAYARTGNRMSRGELSATFYEGRAFTRVRSWGALERALLDAGHGATAIVDAGYADRSPGVHFFNAMNYRGRVYYVDGQVGELMTSHPRADYAVAAYMRTQ